MVTRRDRGQLVLIAGLVIALLVFGVVMLLNSVLFVSNAAPHQASKNIEDGSAYRAVVADDLQRVVDETADGRRYVLPSQLRENVSEYDRHMGVVAAETAPSYLAVDLDEEGSDTIPLLIQDSGGQFDSDAHGDDWRMFDEGHIEEFEMNVEPGAYTASEKFRMTATDGDGDTWELAVSKDNNYPVVETWVDGTPQVTCKGDQMAGGIRIDMTSVTMPESTSCPIEFARGLDEPYSLDLAKGNQITTTYRILVDGAVDTDHTSESGAPYRIDVITSATFDFEYDTPQISYSTTVTDVRPNDISESSDPPSAAFSVSDRTPSVDSAVTFDASVSSDADGTVQNYRWEFGDGTTATGETVSKQFNRPGKYEVELTIEDDDGKTTTVTETVYPYLALNAVGPATTSDSGVEYIEDDGYATGGTGYSTGGDIETVSEPNVYQSERYGTFEHRVKLPNGN